MAFNLGAITGDLKLNIRDFIQNTKRAQMSTRALRKSLRRTSGAGKGTERQMLNVGLTMTRMAQAASALAGGAGMLALGRSFLRASVQVENLHVVLESLFRSTEQAAKGFQELKMFAAQVPQTLEELSDAYLSLAGIMQGGQEQTQAWMPLLADLAAVRPDIPFTYMARNLQQALSGGVAAADMFRDRGISAMLGFSRSVNYTIEETRQKIVEAWTDPESTFRGASKKLANTWTGTMSMMADKWFQFRIAVMDSGIFAFLSRSLRTINAVADNHKDVIEELARKYGDTAATVLGLTTAVIGLGAAWGILNVMGIVSGIEQLLVALRKLTRALVTLNVVGLVSATTGTGSFVTAIVRAISKVPILGAVLKIPISTLLLLSATLLIVKNAWEQNWNGMRDTTNDAVDKIRGWLIDLRDEFQGLIDMLTSFKFIEPLQSAAGTIAEDSNKLIRDMAWGTEEGFRTATEQMQKLREEMQKTEARSGETLYDIFLAGQAKGIDYLEQQPMLFRRANKELVQQAALWQDIIQYNKLSMSLQEARTKGPGFGTITKNLEVQFALLHNRILERTEQWRNRDIPDSITAAIASAGEGTAEDVRRGITEGADALWSGGEDIEGLAGPVKGAKEDIKDLLSGLTDMIPDIGFGEEWAKQMSKEIAEASDVSEEQIEKMLDGFQKRIEEGADGASLKDMLDLDDPEFLRQIVEQAQNFQDELDPTLVLLREMEENLEALKMVGMLDEMQEANLLAPYYFQEWSELGQEEIDRLLEKLAEIAPEAAVEVSDLIRSDEAAKKAADAAKVAKEEARQLDAAFRYAQTSGRELAEIGDLIGNEFTKKLGSAINSAASFAQSLSSAKKAADALKEGGSGISQAMNFTQMASGALGAVGAVMNLVSALGILDEEQEEVSTGWAKAMDEIRDSIAGWADDLTDAIVEFVKTGKFEFKEFVNSVLEDMLRITIRHGIMGPALSALGVEAAAKGGIVKDPTFFGGGGKAGIMGEAGPEAIMPLSRLSDGSLGVKAQGSSGNVQVVINNEGPPITAEVQETEETEDGDMLVRMAVRSELVSAYNDGFMDNLNRAHYTGIRRKGR